MDAPILQSRLFDAPWADPSFRRLPGMRPVGADDWLATDDAYAGQMALRERLIAGRREAVIAAVPGTDAAAAEALETALVVGERRLGFRREGAEAVCPDGRRVALRGDDPLGTLGRLFQEDICILDRDGDEHVLRAAVLCFPSGWTLGEKLGRPLLRIHRPVAHYDADIGRRVQRLFDGLKPDRPLMRANLLWHRDATLHAPRREDDPPSVRSRAGPYVRSERQCLVRLPVTGAVLFTIHTAIVDPARLPADQSAALGPAPPAGDVSPARAPAP